MLAEILALSSFNFFRSYGKAGASIELFQAENDFKTSSAVNYPQRGEPGIGEIDFIMGYWKFWEIFYIPSWQRAANRPIL